MAAPIDKWRAALFIIFLPILIILLSSQVQAKSDSMDFEWREAERILEINTNSSSGWRLLTDEVDGSLYSVCFQYNNSGINSRPDSLTVSKFDPIKRTFEDLLTREYIKYLLDCIVHDGRFYFLYERDDSVFMRTDDGSDVHVINYTDDSNAWYFEGPRFVAASDERIFILTYYRAWERDITYRYFFHANIVEISSQDHSVRDNKILDLSENIIECKFTEKAGTVHLMLERLTGNLSEIIQYGYALGAGTVIGSDDILSAADTYEWSFVIDSAGDIHLAISNGTYDDYTGRLVKMSGTGELISTTPMPASSLKAMMLVNETDHIYIIGPRMAMDTQETHLFTRIYENDHSLEPIVTRHNTNRWFWSAQCLIGANDELIMIWDEREGFHEFAYFTCQTPLAPDLEMLERTFTYREVKNDDEPVHISYQIRNGGNVSSEGWSVGIYVGDRTSDGFVHLSDQNYDVDLEPDSTVTINHSLKLPQGNNLLWLMISDVDPYENNRRNNELRTWIFVSRNNPPTLEVYEPIDDQVVDEHLVVSGYCDDVDIGDELTVIIEGLPEVVHVNASGNWSITIDTRDLPSGDLVISVSCTDGTDLSRATRRHVRIDHVGDTLKIHSVLPAADVDLLLWEAVAFSVNASETFDRPISYTWTTPDGSIKGAPVYIFEAVTLGAFTVTIIVSNGYTERRHTWEVLVREPVYPYISAAMPAEDTITMNKGDTVDLSIAVTDEDDQPHSILWTLKNEPMGYGDVTNITVAFDKGGEYSIAVHVISKVGVDTRHWSIEVINRPPKVSGLTPSEPSIDIERAQTMEFMINVSDPDGDLLTYLWTSTRIEIAPDDQDTTSIRLGYFESETYTITVEVTDGEDTVNAEWTIECTPAVQSEDSRIFTIFLILAVMVVITAVGLYWYRYRL
jgi:hypothetical protein